MVFSGIFLISTGILALQILQTRIFSFTLWHHLAYMVITIALMGMAASGTWLSIRKKPYKKPYLFLSVCSIAFSVTTILSLAVATRIPLDTYMADKATQFGYIFLYYMILILPYFFAGATISYIFKLIKEKINVYYLSNLAGSALGGVAIIPVMEKLGGEGAIFVVAFAGLVAAFLFAMYIKEVPAIVATLVLTVIFSVAYPFRTTVFPVTAPESKAIGMGKSVDPDQKILYTKWDRVARIDVFENKKSKEFFNYYPELENKVITIDGDAYTLLYDFPTPVKENLEYTEPSDFYKNYPRIGLSLYSNAYYVHESPSVLVVGLGGGTDIITALYNGAKSVTGVEINQAMIEVTNEKFAGFIGNPYQDPRVNIVHSEGRSYIRRSEEKYDIIQMSGVDTWTALSTGAYVLSESYIYTSNAMNEYFNQLDDDGTLSIIRWLFWPPREMLRLCTQAVFVLKEMGIEDPENNIVVVGDGHLASILIKKRAFTWSELRLIEDSVNRTEKNRIIYAPGFSADHPYYEPIFKNYGISSEKGKDFISKSFDGFFASVENGKEREFIRDYPFNITPVNDDKPFFFKYYKWRHLISGDMGEGGSFVDKMPVGLLILALSLLQAAFFSFLLILAPLFFMGKKEKTYSPLNQITYFFMIGTGFMFIEIPIIQQFVLFLGNPADAIAVTIMILLFSTGIGALFSKKILILFGEKVIFRVLMMLFPLIILFYAWFIPQFTADYLHSPYSTRILLSTLLLSPLGLFLGQFFPTGLTIVGEKNSAFIPWAYAVNGVASVIASISSIILAMAYGFTFVFTTAAFCYFIACVSIYRFTQRHV
jgi:hypothetical protein